MLLRTVIIALFSLALAAPAFAQKREEKMKAAIDALNTTEFIRKYKEYQGAVEKTAADFKVIATDYPTEDVREVQYAYRSTRDNFNKILETVKKDLLDKKTRNFMKQNPDRYTQFVSQELDLAYKTYQNTVVTKITELTGQETVGIGIMQLKLLLDLVFDVVGVINTIEAELAKMNEKYIEENFIGPLRIKEWEKL